MQKLSIGRKILAVLEGAWLGVLLGLLVILSAILESHEWESDPETEDYEAEKRRV